MVNGLRRFDAYCLERLCALNFRPMPLRLLQGAVRLGDGYIWGLFLVALFILEPLSALVKILLHGILAILISLAFYWAIKLAVRRPRPYNVIKTLVVRIPPLDKYSFPSGHTMNNLALGLTLAYYIPSLFVAALLYPIFCGILRVAFGVHYFSDIAGGVALGVGMFLLGHTAFPPVYTYLQPIFPAWLP